MPDPQGTNYAPGQVKWHPGHYVLLLEGLAQDLSHMQAVIAELDAHPMLRGVQIRYTWAELEPTRDSYDFSRIQRDLDLLHAAGKHLFILLQTKEFSEAFPAVPIYLDTDINGGGSFRITDGGNAPLDQPLSMGKNIKLWNPDVRDRLVGLTEALGRQFNQHPALEGVSLTESAMGFPLEIVVSGAQKQESYRNLLLVNTALRAAFPNTVTIQFTNYAANFLSSFVAGLHDAGAGLGGPDIFLDEPGLLSGIYPYYAQQAGLIPLGPSVQWENYSRRVRNGPLDPPSVDELYRFGQSELHANYMFWTRRAYPKDNQFGNVLAFMSEPGFPSGPSGGLASSCPRSITQCVD